MTIRLVMACDHGGYQLKDELKQQLAGRDVKVEDLGTHTAESVDYPDFAHALSAKVLAGEADLGLLICGTGLGMSMAANRHRGIRAAVCTDPHLPVDIGQDKRFFRVPEHPGHLPHLPASELGVYLPGDGLKSLSPLHLSVFRFFR